MIDHTEWKLEVERVQPLLKVQIQNDNKDWRIHLEQIKNHHSQIEKSVGETREYLVKLDQEITESLEKISSRESYINKQFEPQTQEFRRIQELTSTLSLKHTAANETVSDVSNKLNNISQELDSVKSRIDDIGSGMTDSKPLANIKQGLVRLKNEIKQMDLRTGVIQHNLLNEKMKTKSASNVFQNSEIFAVHVL